MQKICLDQSNCVNETHSKTMHLLLNQIYYELMYGINEKLIADEKLKQFKYLETNWISKFQKKCLENYDCQIPVTDIKTVELALHSHGVYNHPLFDYLCYDALYPQLQNFIRNESILNLEFFDYLALSIVGVSEQAKSEIIRNLWDEAGRGNINKFHTKLFGNFMEELNLTYDRNSIIQSMSWKGLAGINLFSFFAIYSYNKTKYFGLLAATEMLDPLHYKKLIQGINRICANKKITPSYYSEHAIIDIEHARGWLQKVIIPELKKNPHKTQDFWLGFYMRLDSTQEYYDDLFATFSTKLAA